MRAALARGFQYLVGRRGDGPRTTVVLAGVWLGALSSPMHDLRFRLPASPSSLKPPAAPATVTATPTSATTIVVTWSAVTAKGGIANYRVYRNGTLVGTPTTLTLQDSGLQSATTYSYTVSAVNSKGEEGHKSKPVSATTLPDTTPPTTPAGLQASASAPDMVDLVWQPASDPESGVSSYRVYRDGAFLTSSTATSIADATTQPLTTYTYEVSAVNGAGLEGSRSAVATATTPAVTDTTPPTTPSGLQATASGSDRVDLTWQAASDPESGISSYRVYRDGTFLLSTSATAIGDSGVQPHTTYSYEVSAVNGSGLESARSATATATTAAAPDTTPPTSPSALQATVVGPRQVDLEWQAASDPESGVSSYRVYRDGAPLATTSAPSHRDTTAAPQTTYVYQVSAVNGAGLEGSPTGSVSATTPIEPDTTPPAPPVRLRIVPSP